MFLSGRAGFIAKKRSYKKERTPARRRALESMRAALDEDRIVLPRKSERNLNEMQQILSKITIGLALTAIAAFAQTKPAFEVATIKPSPPMDVAKVAAALQAGGKMPIGANVELLRAEYRTSI